MGDRAGRIVATPRARRAARDRGVDLAGLRGSGPDGRIVERDVLAAPVAGADATSGMRRAIARRTAESAATIPHIWIDAEFDASALIALRGERLAAIEREHGVRPTLTDFFLRAMATALREQPRANRVWREDRLVALPTPAVGLVVALDDGLLIPVLAPTANLAATARARRDAAERARRGVADTASCASSLSNLGPGRVDAFSAVIPLGQSSILAVGRAAPRPWAVGDALAVRTTIRLRLAADHRVLDGGPAGDYLGRIVDLLERPQPLLG